MTESVRGGEPTEAQRRLAQWNERIEQQASRYRAAQSSVAGVAVTESSRDGSVRITVNSTGVPTDLVLAPTATELAAPLLAALIMTTMRQAQAKLPGLVAEAMRTGLGDGDQDTVTSVLDSYRQRFPEPPAEPAAAAATPSATPPSAMPAPQHPASPPPAAAPRRQPPPEDDDEWDRQILR